MNTWSVKYWSMLISQYQYTVIQAVDLSDLSHKLYAMNIYPNTILKVEKVAVHV
jgi:hypothetical protein